MTDRPEAPDAATVSYASPIPAGDALALLGSIVETWFRQTFGAPTPAQRTAWPQVTHGANLLLAAPTGSGKTLAAFAPILSQLLTDPQPGLQCLYIAPLKALSRDAGKNLSRQLRQLHDQPGVPRLRLGLRTGDTSSSRRRKQVLQPPHILLTTPESLAILLSQPAGRAMFRSLRWVIVDEVHALAGNKRGVDLALSLERLEHATRLAAGPANQPKPLQRIGLSATCARLEEAGRFLVGIDRPVTLAQIEQPSPLELAIEMLPPEEGSPPRGYMARLLDRLIPLLKTNRTTLVFTNIRSMAERLCWALRRRFPRQARRFGVHHSSLAPGRRRKVERLLKEGRLRCVVSSTSLELGVDIGSIDQVVFLHPPGGATKLLQRLGRSGHRPGQRRRGLLLTGNHAELLESIVTAASARVGQLEVLNVPRQPGDVLCQHLVGMAVDTWWAPEEALALIRRAYPYRDLDGPTLACCLDYLSGKGKDGRPWLLPRLRWDQGLFTLLDDRTARLLRRNLGTILSEEAKEIRLLRPCSPSPLPNPPPQGGRGPGRKQNRQPPVDSFPIGALDEQYADRLQPGDRFILDGRCFEYRRLEEDALLVEEVCSRPLVPHWASHGWVIAPELARRLYLFRLQVAEALRENEREARRMLKQDYHLGRAAAFEVIQLFYQQEAVSEVPDVGTLLIEAVPNDVGVEYFLHTPLNRAGNDALVRVLLHRLEQRLGWRGTAITADLGVLLSLPVATLLEAARWRALLEKERFDQDFSDSLSGSLAFRERFARLARTGMMVLRQPWGRRRKVGGRGWTGRRLFDLVRAADPDFLFLRQAEEEMREHCCDAVSALLFVQRLPQLAIHLRPLASPSPLAESWTQPAEVHGSAGEPAVGQAF